MTEIYTAAYLQENLEVPDDILRLVQAIPRLLPGETDDDYYRLFEMMVSEILPDTDMEWLWTIDLAWLLFDISRYRRWKNAILSTSRRAAIENALAKTNPEALQMGAINRMVRAQSCGEAEALRLETNNRNPLSARLEAHGYDADVINAAAFVQGLGALTSIEKFLTAARHQVAVMLREARLHREFTQRAKEATNRFLAELDARKQAKIGPAKPDEGIALS
jgi:hypothetical protein